MIRWEEQETGDWYGYSGELTVANVGAGSRAALLDGCGTVTGAGRPQGWRNSGHRTTALAARRAADEYWARWLQAGGTKTQMSASSPRQACLPRNGVGHEARSDRTPEEKHGSRPPSRL